MPHPERRRVLAWACYDWANSAFATTVMAGFFPVFFKQYWAAGLSAADSTFGLGAVNSAASLIIVLLAPLLGAIADRAGARRRFLLVFTALGVVSTRASGRRPCCCTCWGWWVFPAAMCSTTPCWWK
jgi:UMF1 family MFS transporter